MTFSCAWFSTLCDMAPTLKKDPKLHSLDVRAGTHFNALKAALDIYIIKAKTGRLPNALPAGLPKDLFSGKDFEYAKTKEGFVLSCQGKDLDKDEFDQYEFKVPK